MNERQDLIIVGGGIVGLATAYRYLQKFPGRSLTVLEKETDVAVHQTGHNSGVLHSGIYYKPGSLKAENCKRGKAYMEAFCAEQNIPFERVGKVIVATSEAQIPLLNNILERGQASGVECESIGVERLAEIEPHVRGVAALHVPGAGIVDYARVCRRLRFCIEEAGGQVLTGQEVTSITPGLQGLILRTRDGARTAKHAVNCTGLHSDRTMEMAGGKRTARIVPFRGEYYELTPESEHLCRGLIYPVPDPKFPFLGVHFTRMIGGGVECGPNAVLALAREGYTWGDFNPADLWDALSYGGFWRMAARHWRTGFGEVWRSLSKKAFVKALSELIPEIEAEHLTSAPAGVRAQALAPDGTMVDDFLISKQDSLLNVLNAPSPAATSALAIGETIADRLP
ncbi:MAG: L-2-hydroxyglutarate oxidase [Planctomycetota bacterium]|nr:L-2-hydroxyglutarate oxidase [Planctomycetota bacterium]